MKEREKILTKENFEEIKLEVQEGRLTMDRMKFFLIAAFLYSIVFVGIGYAVAHANTVGWDNLSAGWHFIYNEDEAFMSIIFRSLFGYLLLG
ncbi:hypothetical protein QQ991_05295 [Weizmannia coagulans]|jgi:hypothetical protein|uniref:Uncharacterized protein n=3 Tax=Heyndrickxia TaxID=2837504 RepID=G2TQT9_HEYCO|nr:MULTISPECIES: hypothetical protein [Heyndrickxia]AEO99937.1 hypothetical protein Bcoa_0718 [Heyndrickxia coagulans 36D1]AJO24253.1 hypothetical protein SB48_HM08orf05533 [Heyndrickxia coagulans]APB38341.1 hypothetical protein BIZ35_17275 [Heyndrickxia coagulans]ATW84139.1 hypothetical protein CIW84_14710 [Heyndrickxia coagulans]AVD55207.1 hypothetical protein C3766_03195 [Heyndrickxia coagulans]